MIDPSIIDAMVAAGASAEVIAAAVRADHAIDAAKVIAKREKNRDRMRAVRVRAQTCANSDAQSSTCAHPSPPSPAPSSLSPSITPIPPTPPTSPTPASLRSAPQAKAKRIAVDWKASSADLDFARMRGLTAREIDVETEKFRNYWTAKGGREAAKLDWPATWRNWILNAVDRRPAAGGFSSAPPRPGSKEDNREKTHAAIQELRGYIDAHADDARGGGDPGGSNVGLLPFAKPARP